MTPTAAARAIREVWLAAVRDHTAAKGQPTWDALQRQHPASYAGWLAVAAHLAAALTAAEVAHAATRERLALAEALVRRHVGHQDECAACTTDLCDDGMRALLSLRALRPPAP